MNAQTIANCCTNPEIGPGIEGRESYMKDQQIFQVFATGSTGWKLLSNIPQKRK
jgi:hypothetical protein